MNRVRPFFLYRAVLVLLVTGYFFWVSWEASVGWTKDLGWTKDFGRHVITVTIEQGTLRGQHLDLGPDTRYDDHGHRLWREPLAPRGRLVWPWGEFEFGRRAGAHRSHAVPILVAGLLLSGVLLACGASGRRRLSAED